MSWRYPQDILHRKLKYLDKWASEQGVELSMDRWASLLKETQKEISYDVIYRILEELYLMLNMGFEWKDFDFPPISPDFEIPDIITPPVTGGTKAYYDETYYDESYYDPPEVDFKQIERFAWSHRYKISEKGTLEYKKMSLALKKLIQASREGVVEAGVADYVPELIEGIMALTEGRILRGAYVGFTVVGLNKVPRRHQPRWKFRSTVDTRYHEDWKTIVQTESVLSWESIVGWVRVSYARVGAWYMVMNKAVSDEAVKRINEFWKRSGIVEAGVLSPYGGLGYSFYGTTVSPSPYFQYAIGKIKTLWPRIFALQRVDQYHYKGGAEQLKMGFDVKRIRRILDRHGVISNLKMGYYSFAKEIRYLYYDSHSLYKQWKKMVSEEDVIQKYIRMGLDENILREIKELVKP